MALLWHVDDIKMSHVDIFEIAKFAGYLSSIYGRLIVHRGKVHAYLRMELNYTKQGTVKVSMIKYLYIVLKNLPENLGAAAATLVSNHLFKVHYESETHYLP